MSNPEGTTASAAPTAPEAKPAGDIIAPSEPLVVESTGDPALDMANSYFAKAGVKGDSLAMQMARSGDFSVLRAELAAKGAEGAAYVAVAEAAHGRAKAEGELTRTRAEAVVQDTMGGKENWAAVKEFIATKASAQELAEINAALKAGGVTAKATADYLKRVYEAGTGVSLSGKSASKEDRMPAGGRQGAPASNGALSPREYSAAVRELARQVGEGRVTTSPEYANLQARRRAWRG
jgi:hypothetical protein